LTSLALRPDDTTQTSRLFEAYSDRLLGYCVKRLGSRSDAEDAVQTTFLYAHRALQRGVAPESESAWLYAIAKNVCRWQQRTSSRRGPVVDGVDLDSLDGLGDGEALEIQRDLEDALATVPERQRRALLLREWRGLSCPEISDMLELSPPATHALLTRARQTVAGALAAAGRRPVLGVDFGSLLLQLRALLTGGAAKTVAIAVAVAGAGVGGVTVEHALAGGHDTVPHAPANATFDANARSASVGGAIGVGTRRDTTVDRPESSPAARIRDGGTAPSVGGGFRPKTPTEAPVPAADAPPQSLPNDPRIDPGVLPNLSPTPPPADALPPPEAQPPAVPRPPLPDPQLLDPQLPDPGLPDPQLPTVEVPPVPSTPVTDPLTGLLP
jgi:RNA polymerase sigma factor (sigma-70 family)